MVELVDGEPPFRRHASLGDLLDLVRTRTGAVDGPGAEVRRVPVVALDGRSGAGTSTLARELAARVPGSVVVGTDDLAWHEPLFGWGQLLEQLLLQVRSGHDVSLTPPQWAARGRDGAITVPATAPLLVVEGVGAAQLPDLVDVAVWVQSDRAEARRLGLARDLAAGTNGDAAASERFWDAWDAAERTFLARARPWERADLVLTGVGADPA